MLAARTTLLAAPILTALVACGGPDGSSESTLAVSTAGVSSRVTWSSASDLDERTAEAIATVADVWGASAYQARGLAVAYTSGLIDCAGKQAVGCATGSASHGWHVQVLALGAPCVEATTLPHELGHVLLGGDPNHTDPRWHDRAFWTLMADRLARSSARNDPSCVAFLEGDGVFRVDAHH